MAGAVARKTLLAIPGCTEDRLRAFEELGLVPAPVRQEHLQGRPNAYEEGTDALVRALVEAGSVETRLDALGFLAWWSGQPVPIKAVRRILGEWVEAVIAEAELLLEENGQDPLAVGERLAERLAQPASRDRLARRPDVGRMKRNADDADDFELIAIPALVLLLYGEQPTWMPPDGDAVDSERTTEEVLAALMGVTRAATEKTPDGRTLLPNVTPVRELFARLKRAGISLEGLPMVLENATDTALLEARDVSRGLVNLLGAQIAVIEAHLGKGALGLGVLRAPAEMPRNVRYRGLMVVMITALRRVLTPRELENLWVLVGGRPQSGGAA